MNAIFKTIMFAFSILSPVLFYFLIRTYIKKANLKNISVVLPIFLYIISSIFFYLGTASDFIISIQSFLIFFCLIYSPSLIISFIYFNSFKNRNRVKEIDKKSIQDLS